MSNNQTDDQSIITNMSDALDEASGSLNIGPDGIFEMACDLLKDPTFIADAINPEKNKSLGEALLEPERLSLLLLADDTNKLGQIVQDKIIQYAMNKANQMVVDKHKASD